MHVPGFNYNPIMLAIEGAVIGFVIAVPVGPAAALCIRRSITIGAVAGYLTGLGAALGDAVFGAIAAFGLTFEEVVGRHEAWLRGIGGLVLIGMGWSTMRHRLRTVGDPVSDDAEHRVATHFNFGPFSWDKFYHCILTSDSALLQLIEDLGLTSELHWINRTYQTTPFDLNDIGKV